MAPLKPKPKPKTVVVTTAVAAASGGGGAGKRRLKLKWRTRDSQNSQLYNLQLDINDLQQEIQQLQQTKSIVLMQTRLNRMDDRDGSFVKVVNEYHRVFQRGFRPVVVLPDGRSGQRIVDTMEFLSRVMDERVSIGRFAGLDTLRDQWTRYSRAFSNLELQHMSSTVLPEMDYVTPSGTVRSVAMVSSKATYSSKFTIETMALMFPHLRQRHRRVLEKLLGQTFNGVVDFDFVFDTKTHRVIGYDFRLDFLTAFARLLHDPEDLCLLFEGATISEESLIGDLDVYPQATAESSVHLQQPTPSTSTTSTALTTMRSHRALDPVVLKYATRTSGGVCPQTQSQLHSKLVDILDSADREPPAPVAHVEPLPPPVKAVQAPPLLPRPRLPSLVHDSSNRSFPWQLQMAPAPATALPSLSSLPHYEDNNAYFPASALAGRGMEVDRSAASSLAKQQHPFASDLFSYAQQT